MYVELNWTEVQRLANDLNNLSSMNGISSVYTVCTFKDIVIKFTKDPWDQTFYIGYKTKRMDYTKDYDNMTDYEQMIYEEFNNQYAIDQETMKKKMFKKLKNVNNLEQYIAKIYFLIYDNEW